MFCDCRFFSSLKLYVWEMNIETNFDVSSALPNIFLRVYKQTKLEVANSKTTHFKLLCLSSFEKKRATVFSGNCWCNKFFSLNSLRNVCHKGDNSISFTWYALNEEERDVWTSMWWGTKGAPGPAHVQLESRIRFGRPLEATVFIANI